MSAEVNEQRVNADLPLAAAAPSLTAQRHIAEQLAADAAAALNASFGRTHEVAVVIGSGWARAAQAIGPVLAEVDATDIPGMRAPGVQGHGSRVASIAIDEQRAALVFLGRTHLYEGHGAQAVAHIVRTAAAHGCRTVVLTNGSGAINPEFAPGQVVLVRDHINLTAQTALVGPEFVDLTDLYSQRLRDLVLRARLHHDGEGPGVPFTMTCERFEELPLPLQGLVDTVVEVAPLRDRPDDEIGRAHV